MNSGRYYVLQRCGRRLSRYLKKHLADKAKRYADNFGCGVGRCEYEPGCEGIGMRPPDRHPIHPPGTPLTGEWFKPKRTTKAERGDGAGLSYS